MKNWFRFYRRLGLDWFSAAFLTFPSYIKHGPLEQGDEVIM